MTKLDDLELNCHYVVKSDNKSVCLFSWTAILHAQSGKCSCNHCF